MAALGKANGHDTEMISQAGSLVLPELFDANTELPEQDPEIDDLNGDREDDDDESE